MKRSEINQIIREAKQFLAEQKMPLPFFAKWSPTDWQEKGPEYDEIRDNMLGWDITDYGLGKFDEVGLILITTRNGNSKKPEKYPKPYAEKIMIVKENQVTPMHYHWYKMEDIINRGGGNLIIQLYNSKNETELDKESEIYVTVDGVSHTFPAGYKLCLEPGQSVTLQTGLFHAFWGEGGDVLVMEVSMCNDDNTDNYFYKSVGRFPEIEEDEEPLHYLCNEYPKAIKKN